MVKFAATATLCFLGVLATSGKKIPTFAGPYRVVITRITNSSDEFSSTGKMWHQLRTTPVQYNREQYGWGYSYSDYSVTDEMKVEVRMAVRSNNQWKKNAFVFRFDHACSSFLTLGKSLVDLIYYGLDLKSCPFPAIGLYEVKNHSFEVVFPHFPVMPYSTYQFSLGVIRNTEVFGVAVAEVQLVPKL